jgi:hypothetical protein
MIEVSRLVDPEMLVEIEAEAIVLPHARSRTSSPKKPAAPRIAAKRKQTRR